MPSIADLEELARRADVEFQAGTDSVSFGPVSIDISSGAGEWFDPALKDLVPRKVRGDYRERTVNLLVRDAVERPGNVKERDLFGEDGHGGAFGSDELIADPSMRPKFGEVLMDHYVVEAARRTRFLFPFHTDLPGNFQFSGRYKLFNGVILAFLAKRGAGDDFNRDLLARFYELFNSDDDLTLLDESALRIASDVAQTAEWPVGRRATPQQLIDGPRRGELTYGEELVAEPFFPAVHDLVQQDLARALDMRSLGRKDRVNAVLTVFYFHLALFFWRTAFVLDEEVNAFLQFLAGEPGADDALRKASDRTLEGSPFRGQLRFRAATARPRRIKQSDPAARSFNELNDQRLRLLPVNLSLLGAARKLTGQLAPAGFAEIADALRQDPVLAAGFDPACRAAALLIADDVSEEQRDDIHTAVASREPGLIAFRTSVLKRWRSDLRRSSTDITSGLMKRGGKGIFATRGNVKFFEIGQDLLLLLTKLVAGDREIRYADFIARLSLYGLAPQTREEESTLAEVLRSLQLLEKYSDTGEAMYVKHFL